MKSLLIVYSFIQLIIIIYNDLQQGTQLQSIFNSVLALTSTAMAAAYTSRFFGGRFSGDIFRKSALAGGVFIGSSASLILYPWITMLTANFIGILTVFLMYYWPKVEQVLGFNDSNGIFYLHGIPGVLGAIQGIIATSAQKKWHNEDGDTIFGVPYPQVFGVESANQDHVQGGFLFISAGLGIAAGVVAGLLIRLFPGLKVKPNVDYSDAREWRVPDDFPPLVSRIVCTTMLYSMSI